MEELLKDQILQQIRVLEEELEQGPKLTLLKLWAEDVVGQGGDLDEVSVHLDEALSARRLHTPERLSWCKRVGTDRFGVFAEVDVGSVSFKMRYILAGRFLMGSPENEEGRYEGEGPQHEVVLSKDFWLCETPCTQGLWEAVMDENPSKFKSPKRPVEYVSFIDCQTFLRKLNDRIFGLQAQLPTEAQWEYACRAGTTTSTYAGELKILGRLNGPMLDEIAWYGGNSGCGFDLELGGVSSDWDEKQYDHKRAGTRLVGLKDPNVFGLFDMLGNVREWCADGMRDYKEGCVVDPVGSQEEGSFRVVRGGGWYQDVRNVRAAYRCHHHPVDGLIDLSFRFCRGQ